LVVDAPTPLTAPIVVEFAPAPIIDYCCIAQSIDFSRITIAHWQREAIDTSPPPIDIVITQLRLTI
jgi:hypothetical protein